MNIWVGIYRPEWLRGTNPSALLDTKQDGKKCCLGFLCMRLGYSADRIADLGLPASLREVIPGLTEPYERPAPYDSGVANTELCREMMGVNDDQTFGDTGRERRLKKLALEAGYHFVFTDYSWLASLVTVFDKLRHHIWDRYCYGS